MSSLVEQNEEKVYFSRLTQEKTYEYIVKG